MLGKRHVFHSTHSRLAHGCTSPLRTPSRRSLEKREFWVGQGRNRSDRFAALSKKSLPGAAERRGAKTSPGGRRRRAESGGVPHPHRVHLFVWQEPSVNWKNEGLWTMVSLTFSSNEILGKKKRLFIWYNYLLFFEGIFSKFIFQEKFC